MTSSTLITVYSKPGCVQCKYTKAELDKMGLSYGEIDITLNRMGRKQVEASGKTELPMVVAGDKVWHGFKIDELRALKSAS